MPTGGSSSTSIAKRRDADEFGMSVATTAAEWARELAGNHTEDAVRTLVEVATATEREIVPNAGGTEGFGYDPLFFSPELGKTFGEATADEKASVSHRGRALRKLREALLEPDDKRLA